MFYYEHNRFNEAKEYFNRCLSMELSPDTRVGVLKNMGDLLVDVNENPEAEKAFAEALEIRRQLADEDPQTYMPALAKTLLELGCLYTCKRVCGPEKKYYDEALKIFGELAKQDPDTYNPDLAMSIHYPGNCHYMRKDYEQAEKYHKEALQLYRDLAAKDAEEYCPNLTIVLRDLGAVYNETQQYGKAEKCYTTAVVICRKLTWNHNVAQTLVNMAEFYQKNLPDKALSIKHAKEALEIFDQYSDDFADVKQLRSKANWVLEQWKEE